MTRLDPPALRVLTQNIWAHGGDWPARREALRAGFARLSPDLVALQETVVRGDQDQVRDLFGDEYHVVHSRIRGTDGIGISIASRWPLHRPKELDLRMRPGDATGTAPTALLAEVDVPEVGRVIFVNHVRSWQPRLAADREQQAVKLATALDRYPVPVEATDAGRIGIPHIIVAGDLDADPASTSVRFWTGRHAIDGRSVCYRDAWEAAHGSAPGETFTPDNPLMADPDWPFRRIDYILVRCADHGGPTLSITGSERLFDQPERGVWASDHFGVWADLELPRKATAESGGEGGISATDKVAHHGGDGLEANEDEDVAAREAEAVTSR
jgi:endonuclease/exonuclease/phosphatase family metal-dependent hydrolase